MLALARKREAGDTAFRNVTARACFSETVVIEMGFERIDVQNFSIK